MAGLWVSGHGYNPGPVVIGLSTGADMTDLDASTRYDWLPTYPGGVYCLASWQGVDGRRIASGGSDGAVHVWDAATGRRVGEPVSGHSAAVRALAAWMTHGGMCVASGGSDGHVRVWDADTHELILSFPTGSGVMAMTAWLDECGAERLATGNYNGVVQIWDPSTAELVWAPRATEGASAPSLVAHVTADGVLLASGDDMGMLSVWNVSTQSLLLPPCRVHDAPVEQLLWCTNRLGHPLLVSGGEDGTVRMWEFDGGLTPRWTTPREGPVWSLAAWQDSDGGQLVAAGDTGGAVRIIDLESGTLRRTLHYSDTPVVALERWSDDAGAVHLALASNDGIIRILRPDDEAVLQEMNSGHVVAVWALTHWEESHNVHRLASAGLDGILRVWDPDTGSLVAQAPARHGPGIWALTVGVQDGRHVVYSGSLDGSIQAWDGESALPQGQPRAAHTASVSDLVCWQGSDGSLSLASVGDDSAVSFWHALDGWSATDTGTHHGGLLSVAHWTPDGQEHRVVTAGTDRTVRLWDPATGTEAGPPLADAGSGGFWGLCSWLDEDGSPRIALGGFDGSLSIWNPLTGSRQGTLPSPEGPDVRALVCWQTDDGRTRIASTNGSEIRVWDPVSCHAVGTPLRGHLSSIRALTVWRASDGTARLASAGDDGSIRLWDPDRGVALRTVEVGAITVWGLSDAPARTDLLDRTVMAAAVADQIRGSSVPAGTDLDAEQHGPAVITLEGPWGAGKSSLMRLIRLQLADPSVPPGIDAPTTRPFARRMTVREAVRLLQQPPEGPEPAPDYPDSTIQTRYVTAWFNPWTHQSGEQIWSGLADCIIAASAPILFPGEAERERYWFTRNLKRVDSRRVIRTALRLLVSPMLGAALLVIALPLTVSLLQLKSPVPVLGHHLTGTGLALVVPCVFLIAGGLHTWVRYHRGWASSFLARELFEGPMTPSEGAGLTAAHGLTSNQGDPLRSAQKGALYLRQHHVVRLLSDLSRCGFEFVMFIDDLDRCQASTTVEIFEAVNLFLFGLTGSDVRVRFVIGMDPTVVTAHLDQAYHGLQNPGVGPIADDPSIGWAFLRKLSQLPVPIPYIQDTALERFVDSVLGPIDPPATGSHAAPDGLATHSALRVSPSGPTQEAARSRAREHRSPSETLANRTGPPPQAAAQVISRHALQQHPQVQAFLRQRLALLPERSIRETKRLLNVWQFLIRLSRTEQLGSDPADHLSQARQLATLAEIITRWPALQQPLHRRIDGRTGLLRLAAAAESEDQWNQAVQACGVTAPVHAPALCLLRQLLRECDGHAVAQLAAKIL